MKSGEMDDIIANIRYDPRLASYKTFFDHQWAKDIRKLVSGTKLEPPVDSLTFHWKSVANAHLMPWLIADSLKGWAKGFLLAHNPTAVQVVGVVQQKIQRKLDNEAGKAISRRGKKRVIAIVKSIAKDVLDQGTAAKQAAARNIRSTDIWSALIGHHEFVFSICGSQRLCYAGIYFAYENFVRQCTSLATSKPESYYQNDFTMQRQDMVAVFGKECVENHIADERVNIARLVRNALVHGGGRISDELRKISHGLEVEDDVLQIMAPDTSNLFQQLKTRAFKLAELAVKLPAIK